MTDIYQHSQTCGSQQPSTSSALVNVLFIRDLCPKWQPHNWKIAHSVAHTKSANMWSTEHCSLSSLSLGYIRENKIGNSMEAAEARLTP